jgi:hypothetical protein
MNIIEAQQSLINISEHPKPFLSISDEYHTKDKVVFYAHYHGLISEDAFTKQKEELYEAFHRFWREHTEMSMLLMYSYDNELLPKI